MISAMTATIQARGYAALGQGEALVPFEFERRAVGPRDVRLEINDADVRLRASDVKYRFVIDLGTH